MSVAEAAAADASAAARERRAAWRTALLALLLALAWVIFLYRDTALAMVTIWYRSETFTHGFLVPPISLWLIWRLREELLLAPPRPAPLIAGLVLLSGVGWLFGELAAVNALMQFAFVATLVLAVPLVLGLAAARRIAFPLGFLFFAVPIGEFVMPQMMQWTAHFTVMALRLTGIPVYQEGLQFIIPSGSWSVVEACSGVRYLIASLTVGTLFAYLNYVSTWRRLVFVGVSILVPIIANWARAYIIVMLGHLSGNKLAAGADHLIYGWVFFGIVIMLMFLIGARWSEPPLVAAPRRAAGAVEAMPRVPAIWGAALLAAAVASVPLWLSRQLELSAGGAQAAVAVGQVAGWSPVATWSDWRPAYQNPVASFRSAYARADGRNVGVFIAYYRNQGEASKLVSSDNDLVKSVDKDWVRVASGVGAVEVSGTKLQLKTAELRGPVASIGTGGERLVVWHWYWIDGRWTASDHVAKLYTALSRLSGRGDDSAAVIIYARKEDGDALLAEFSRAALAPIAAALAEARSKP